MTALLLALFIPFLALALAFVLIVLDDSFDRIFGSMELDDVDETSLP